MLLILCLLLPVLAIGLDVSTFDVQKRYSPSAEIWSEDFNDLIPDGWEFWGMDYSHDAPSLANYSVAEGMLRFQGGKNWTIAMYNITQAVGTWSFDLDVQDSYAHHFYVSFFSGYWANDSIIWPNWRSTVPYEYGIMVVSDLFLPWSKEFILYQRSTGSADYITTLERYSPPEIIGRHHFDITRDSSGQFNVYINGALRLSGNDTAYTTSECFKIYSPEGPAIDNIVVDDEIKPPLMIDPLIIAVIGGGALVALVVIVIIIRRKR